MASLVTWLALLGVAAILGATLLYIREWGPGLVVRRIRCPVKEVEAKVTFLQKEGDFGSMKVEDVVECSLFDNAPVTCEKKCKAA